MSDFKKEEKIQELRDRLYARGKGPINREKFILKDSPKEVPNQWQHPPKAETRPLSVASNTPPAPVTPPEPVQSAMLEDMAPRRSKKRYRLKILLAGVVFFVLAVMVSSVLFIAGSNSISGDNIEVSITGPFTIGGGEVIPLQIGVTNRNTVPINSATLIVTYPEGTQSVTEEGKELFVERLPLDTIASGETLNIPLRAVVFGEENQEKLIQAEIEYRVQGSNSTFAKKAEPLRFKVSSSPVTVSLDSLYKVSSGQETDVTLKVSSNAPTPLTNILVRAEYPSGFDFTSSKPAPVSGQNVWRIDELAPEGNTEITIKGIVVGNESEKFVIHFSAGVSNDQDQTQLASIFSTASTEFLIEQPFLNVSMEVNGDNSGAVAAVPGETVVVEVSINNTLPDTIYDGRVELALSGNALSDYEVRSTDGFYDSKNKTIYWDSSDIENLQQIAPGASVSFRVSLVPDPNVKETPQLGFDVDARARRVTEGRVTEELIGTASAVLKVASAASIITEVGRDTSIFTESGSIPPVAEEATTYTLTFFTQNGSNDMGDAEVTATLPNYVRWLNNTTGAGSITFNETTRVVTWNVGDIDANQSKIAAFQVSLEPSISQVGSRPTLLGEQRFRGTDLFTGSVVRTQFRALTTQLIEEQGYPKENGTVQAP